MIELTTTQVAKRLNISAIKLNKILIEKGVIYRRGRPAKSEKGKYRPYYWIDDKFIKYGFNKVNARGGSSPRWYGYMVNEFIRDVIL